MPRNASGLYSLPTGNPVIPGTRITSNWANTTLGDIATALTQSLPINDGSTMTASLTGKTLTGGTFNGPNIQDPNIFSANITMDSGATVLRPPGGGVEQGAFFKLEGASSDPSTNGYNIDTVYISGKAWLRVYRGTAPSIGFQLPLDTGAASSGGLIWSSGTHMGETDRYDFVAPPAGVLKLAKQGSNGWGGADRPPPVSYNVNDNTLLSRNCIITYDGAGGPSSGGPASAAGPLLNVCSSDVLSAQMLFSSNLNAIFWRPRFDVTPLVWGVWRTMWDSANTPKMTTQVDTTPGAMMTSSSWGIGTPAPSIIANANSTFYTGFYATSGSTINLPVVANGSFIVGHGPTNYVSQSYMYPSDETNILAHLAIRMFNNAGGVGPWTRVQTNFTMVGTVSQLAGLPAYSSSIIERGVNANGHYVRFADGTQICWQFGGGAQGMGAYGAIANLYYGIRSWTYPAAFTGSVMLCGAGADSVTAGWLSLVTTGAQTANVYYYSAASSNSGIAITYMAVGRWV